MIKLYTAFTKEIDNPEAAVKEILEQLNPEKNMQKNTIGIIYFYNEFVDEGICKAILDALPFELAGCVSSYIGTGGLYSDVALSVTMLTGDDVHFAIQTIDGVSAKTGEQIAAEVTQLCTQLCAKEEPKMVMPFLSMQTNFNGDNLVSVVNTLSKPLPLFGTIAFNMESTEGTHYVLAKGSVSADKFAFVAFYGNIQPKFHYTSAFAFDESFGNAAVITDASGPILKTVDNMTALSYLKKQNMVTEDNSVTGSAMWAVPAILTYPNGTKVVRGFVGVVEGSESIFATGFMETGAKVTFAFLDGDKTLASAEKLMEELIDSKENDIIAFSCAARAWSLGSKFFAEAHKIAECADKYQQKNNTPFNYCVAYSGGEICPVLDNDGNLINILHNYTLAVCSFENGNVK